MIIAIVLTGLLIVAGWIALGFRMHKRHLALRMKRRIGDLLGQYGYTQEALGDEHDDIKVKDLTTSSAKELPFMENRPVGYLIARKIKYLKSFQNSSDNVTVKLFSSLGGTVAEPYRSEEFLYSITDTEGNVQKKSVDDTVLMPNRTGVLISRPTMDVSWFRTSTLPVEGGKKVSIFHKAGTQPFNDTEVLTEVSKLAARGIFADVGIIDNVLHITAPINKGTDEELLSLLELFKFIRNKLSV